MQISWGQRRSRPLSSRYTWAGSPSCNSPFFWCEIVRPPMESETLAGCRLPWCRVIPADTTPHNLTVGVEPRQRTPSAGGFRLSNS
jgi:hypothetical protein